MEWERERAVGPPGETAVRHGLEMRLRGKAPIITGGVQGIGKACALRLADEDYYSK